MSLSNSSLAEHSQLNFDEQQAEGRNRSPDSMPSHENGYMQACKLCDQYADYVYQQEQELETLRGNNVTLQKQLQACKDDLFRLQPSQQVPDSTITQAWNDLKEEVTSWIDAEVLCLERERGQDRSPFAPFSDGGEARVRRFLKANPELGGEHLVRSYIHQRLQRGLLDDSIMLFGMGFNKSRVLHSVQKNMDELQPRKETGSILKWRSETLLSIAASQDYLQNREAAVAQLARDIFRNLARFFPIINGKSASYAAFCEKIVTPAAKLATTIQTSPSCYRFRPRLQEDRMFTDYLVAQEDIPHHKFVDVKTGKTLKINAKVTVDQDGLIGKQIMCLAPGLSRYEPGGSPVKLAQEVALLELNQPPSERGPLRILRPRNCKNQETIITSENHGHANDVDHSATFTESMPGSFPGGC